MSYSWIEMRAYSWLILMVLLVACEPSPHESSAPAGSTAQDVVASYDEGSVSFAAVEERVATARGRTCRIARRRQGGGSLDALIPCYREVAERFVIERLIVADIPDVQQAIEGLGERYYQLRQRAFLNPFYRRIAEGGG